MEKNAVIRVFNAKSSGKRCVALVVKYGDNRETMFFDKPSTFMRLLDLKPSDFYDLQNGDYDIA